MSFRLENLDLETRNLMREEIELDINAKTLYISERLNAVGKGEYPTLLLNAAKNGTADTLATSIQDFLNVTEEKYTRGGGKTMAKVPSNAHETLAEGEFNRFYIRALCKRVIQNGGQLEIYRAKLVANPRSDSYTKIGKMVDPELLLKDLRAHPGVDTAFGLPSGPNSGLSVKINI